MRLQLLQRDAAHGDLAGRDGVCWENSWVLVGGDGLSI